MDDINKQLHSVISAMKAQTEKLDAKDKEIAEELIKEVEELSTLKPETPEAFLDILSKKLGKVSEIAAKMKK